MALGRGVDLHPYYQRGAQITSDVSFAWIKMTDGAHVYVKHADGRDWTADEHARRLRAARVPFGGYVYAQPGDGGAEARVLWDECRRLGGTGVAPSCDIESNKDIHTWSVREATDHGRAFCSAMRRLGVRPAVYMDLTLLRDCRPDRWPEDPVIWAPRYGAKPEQLLNGVQYLGRYDVHQYTSSGSLPGSAGKVDWNQAYTTAYLIGEDDMPLSDTDITKIVDAMRKRVIATDHDPNDPNANTEKVWTINGRNLWDTIGDARNRVEAIQGVLTDLVLKVAAQQSVPIHELAQALLPDLLAEVKKDLTDVEHLDEDAVADRLAANLAARLSRSSEVSS